MVSETDTPRLPLEMATYWTVHTLSRLFFSTVMGLEIRGVENIPREGPLLICSNHLSYLDPLLLGCAIPHPIWIIARKTLFVGRFMNWLLPRLHSIPLDRDKPDLAGIRAALRVLESGRQLIIFPEGYRTKDGGLQPGQPGAGLIALKAGVPILPIRIRGTFECLSRHAKNLTRHPVSVTFGPVVRKEDLPAGLKGQEAYQAISNRMMEEIAKL